MERYILGSGQRLEIQVSIFNAAEDAFESMLSLQLPQAVGFVNIERGEAADTSVLCSAPSEETGHVLRCDLGNPLPAFRTVTFRILLQVAPPTNRRLAPPPSSSSATLIGRPRPRASTDSTRDQLLFVCFFFASAFAFGGRSRTRCRRARTRRRRRLPVSACRNRSTSCWR